MIDRLLSENWSIQEKQDCEAFSGTNSEAEQFSRLKAYRKKLIAVITANSFCDCCGEPLKQLYSNDDHTHIDELENVLDVVRPLAVEEYE